MKYFVQTLILIGTVVFFTGCQSVFSPEVDGILCKMRKKIDPQGKLPGITSKVVDGTFRRNSKEQGATISIKVQNPNMIRYDVVIPGDVSLVKAFDGKNGWEYSTKAGYKELKGEELKHLKFQAAFLNPTIRAEGIFSSIKIDGEAKVMGQMCYKLICQPKKEYDSAPITMYVDKTTYLLRKRIETQGDEKSGTFSVSTIMHDYKSFDGILVPQTLISKVNDKLMEFEVTSVKWNEDIHISAFDPPEQLKN